MNNRESKNATDINLDALEHDLTISQCSLANHAARELIRRLREAERDAARYEFLRKCGFEQGNILGHYAEELMDEKVDSAMSKEADNG
jgi:hypothetical protein